jgi:hypothetical protein
MFHLGVMLEVAPFTDTFALWSSSTDVECTAPESITMVCQVHVLTNYKSSRIDYTSPLNHFPRKEMWPHYNMLIDPM